MHDVQWKPQRGISVLSKSLACVTPLSLMYEAVQLKWEMMWRTPSLLVDRGTDP
ncbi:hypothetical protein AMATHDRAFT_54848 [Amanita thiersii Skay4041]|uniref:Uncharacterized protein n=1 Tax=Amanita thiersii Skay4041 TaxID=703135 RepID=A0A2A9NZQ4_9AGAR|nr:hypothetical protein AMATHDRAFT_54848 [Amanita thiersii Skay4041]